MPSNDPDIGLKPTSDNFPSKPARNPGHGHTAGLLLFGDGSDGVCLFDGTTTILGLVPSSKVYTLTRDIYLADGSVVGTPGTTGVKIETAGFRIFAKGLILALSGNGTIDNSGAAAVTTTGGAAATTGVTFGGAAGAGGASSTTSGTAGTSKTSSFGGASGAGGLAAGQTQGAAATAAAPSASLGSIHSWPGFLYGGSFPANGTPFTGGAGGSGGAGDGSHAGGAGGGGGGPVFVAAETIGGTLTIQANGGPGAAANASGNGGGGSGGGGGFVVLITGSGSAGKAPTGVTVQALAGVAGAGVGTGAAGSASAAGTVLVLN